MLGNKTLIFEYVLTAWNIKEMVHDLAGFIELWMHAGGLEGTKEA